MSAGNVPKASVSTTESCAMLPGATVTLMEAGDVGVQASPSATMPVPSTACANAPIATIAFRLTASRSESSGMLPG